MMASESQTSPEGDWVAAGVDDLTKYRVIEHLLGPSGGDVAAGELANALGFRSLEQLEVELAELATVGIVAASPGDGAGKWRVRGDAALITRLRAMLSAEAATPDVKAEVIAGLARRSLARTRTKNRGVRNDGRAASHGGHQPPLFSMRSVS
jgi:hypothetical protein